MDLSKAKTGLALSALFLLCAVCARADQQELQLGYVFNGWDSNSLFHGTEHRVPLSYYYSAKDFSLSLSSAFVVGNYVEDADPAKAVAGASFNASRFTNTSLGVNLGLDMDGSLKSNFSGSLTIPTGDDNWETAQQIGAIPYIFEPSYYHGSGWGGNLFYILSVSEPGLQYGAGAGYMAAGTYDTGLSAQGTFSPGDNLVALATVGFGMSPADSWAFRYVRTFPMESIHSDPSADFTQGAANIVTTQWSSRMGADRLVVTGSYSFYNAGSTAQPTPPYSLAADPSPYFGDRLELHPVMGYSLGRGVVMESGLLGMWIQPNGFPKGQVVNTQGYEGGGILLGAEQSLTFQLSQSSFLNLAGLYHYIINDNADLTYTTAITYQRFSFGTNVGFKW